MQRWYDTHEIGKYLDCLQDMNKKERDPIINGIMQLVKKNGFEVDKYVMSFPLESLRRRWYDKDPYLWIIFNGLQNANKKLLDEIAEYMKKALFEVER